MAPSDEERVLSDDTGQLWCAHRQLLRNDEPAAAVAARVWGHRRRDDFCRRFVETHGNDQLDPTTAQALIINQTATSDPTITIDNEVSRALYFENQSSLDAVFTLGPQGDL